MQVLAATCAILSLNKHERSLQVGVLPGEKEELAHEAHR